jgi:hypothetical protein
MQDLTGIDEKLKRAKENIFNLNSEIEGFFNEGKYPVIPEHDREILLEAIQYHKNRVIPPRFSVLAGEIIHHFRSCFDHIVWHFSMGPKHDIRKIEFPIFEHSLNHNTRKSFEGKIHAVTDPNAISLIERLQPYNAPDPVDDPLLIIHKLDIIDKHKELVLCFNTGARIFPTVMQPIMEAYQRAHPELNGTHLAEQFNGYGILQPCISFRDFGRREVQPATLGLMDLLNYTTEVVEGFKSL